MGQAGGEFLKCLGNHQLATGFVLGLIANYINSVFQDWRTRRNPKAKQQRFIEELNESMAKYVGVAPKDEDEVERIRKEVASKVKELSKKDIQEELFLV